MTGPLRIRLPIEARRQHVDEWALVLVAEGLSPSVHETEEGFVLEVPAEQAQEALAALSAYASENPPGQLETEGSPAASQVGVALAVSASLVAFFLVTGPRDARVAWFAHGSADAEAIVQGEFWRTVTALTLHADLAHVLSNAIVGAFFLNSVCRVLGAGLGCALILLAGAGGNLVNAWFHGAHHSAVGASTAVFGAVGVLGGLGLIRRRRRGARGRSAWAPVAAGLALLAMLGTAGAHVDLWAHLFGFGVGAALGIPAALAFRRPPGPALQWTLGAATFAALLYCWGLALGA
jgi:membrane associated rhomboid family serine protease